MKLGIVGAGGIVKVCLEAVQQVENIDVESIYVLEREKHIAEELCAKFGIKKIYTDYAEFLADQGIDVVYIGIINSLHYIFSKQALEAGKGVIC